MPFKGLLWWHFFIISQLEVKRQEKMWESGCNKATTDPGKPEMLPWLWKHLHQPSHSDSYICLFFIFKEIIIILNLFSFEHQVVQPKSARLEIKPFRFLTTFHRAYYSAVIHFWAGKSICDIYRLWPDFIDSHRFIPHGASLRVCLLWSIGLMGKYKFLLSFPYFSRSILITLGGMEAIRY